MEEEKLSYGIEEIVFERENRDEDNLLRQTICKFHVPKINGEKYE